MDATSGYYDPAVVTESHLAKLTTLELLTEAQRRLDQQAKTSSDGRPESGAASIAQAIGLVNWMAEYP